MKKADQVLIQRVLDGKVSRKEFAAFQERLRASPDLLRAYREYALLDHSLSEEFEGMPFTRRSAIAGAGNSWAVAGSFAAAAAIVLVVAVLWMKSGKRKEVAYGPARMDFLEDAVWEIKGTKVKAGEGWNVSRGAELKLEQGRAEIVLGGGATGWLEGPAELRLDSMKHLYLKQGRGFFRISQKGRKLEVETASLLAVDMGTAFGVTASRDKPDELRVVEGKVKLLVDDGRDGPVLEAGEGVRVTPGADAGALVERFAFSGNEYAVGLREFEKVVEGPFRAEDWRVAQGAPEVSPGMLRGKEFQAYRKVRAFSGLGDRSVILATLALDPQAASGFHTGEWAGLSFLWKGEEMLFFGDSFGAGKTWSLDLKQGEPVIHPEKSHSVEESETVTMRYDAWSGLVTLHSGGLPLDTPFCRGWIAPGTKFDEIRIATGPGAEIAAKRLEILVKP